LSLGSEGTCQIGGNLSTNAGGTAVLHYGVMRDLVLGLEAVLPNGEVLDQLQSLRKDNTGYDIKQLFIGAEGTLGVITGATLKLFPKPANHATAFLAVTDLKAAVDLLGALRQRLGGSLVAFEVMPRFALELAIRHIPGVTDPLHGAHPWYVLAEIALADASAAASEPFAAALNRLIEAGAIRDAVLASSEAQRLSLWHIRENIPAAQTREGASIKHDISLPIASIPEFVATAQAAVLAIEPGARMVSYGHLGDGNLHFNFSPAAGAAPAPFLAKTEAIKRVVHDLVAERRGSFSAEHGIGKLKVGELARYENPVALGLMRLVKRDFDPHNIMNPGKVLAV
jgi:FAD/FMN-containing dehydrogenase